MTKSHIAGRDKLLLAEPLLLRFVSPMRRRGVWLVGVLGAVGTALVWTVRPAGPEVPLVTAPARPAPAAKAEDRPPPPLPDDVRAHGFRVPTGEAPALSCEDARGIVAQSRAQLAYAPEPVDAKAFADATADWLDPYGLWSVAPDTPVTDVFDARASELLAELESKAPRDCAAARVVGAELATWVDELRRIFDEAAAAPGTLEDAATAASTPTFEGVTVTRPARALAASLGRHVAAVEHELGPAAHPYVDQARTRYFPSLDAAAWARVVLAAAVRAYVPTIDPHGAWAPLDEESSVYEVDLEARPPTRLWDKCERTAVGVRIESGAAPPLADGDVVLSLAGVVTAGLSFEQSEQLGYAASEARPPAQTVVLRAGERLPITTWLDGAPSESRPASGAAQDDDDLPVERVEYGDGDVVIVAIHDVRDDLGDELTRALLREREQSARPLEGVVIDLRGNGGGSTDGAIDALGLFIPGAPLFPMKRRDGTLETDRAPEPPAVDRWRGPVATLVDSDTASAAEMIAGALAAYRRGPTVGTTTFGKGCAQEYLDDEAHAGVLRLTTLLYALPDGTPVQRVGLSPALRFPFVTADANDREASLLHAPPTWRGPDVRDRSIVAHGEDGSWTATWPPSGGNVGPCKDADTCRALRLLGSAPVTARRTPPAKGR
jgi:carboxyl-terminal processing protease